jgi:hypothetical protein
LDLLALTVSGLRCGGLAIDSDRLVARMRADVRRTVNTLSTLDTNERGRMKAAMVFLRRFDIEHAFCLFTQTLGWTCPKIRTPGRVVGGPAQRPKALTARHPAS